LFLRTIVLELFDNSGYRPGVGEIRSRILLMASEMPFIVGHEVWFRLQQLSVRPLPQTVTCGVVLARRRFFCR